MLKVFILTACLLVPPVLTRAQGPAFDPDCYFPRVGVLGEIDTIIGGQEGQEMGYALQGLGLQGNSPYQSVVIGGLPALGSAMGEVQSGPNFSLNTLRTTTKKSKIADNALIVKRGPFQHAGSNDAFVLIAGGIPYIYWGDSNGELSDERRTFLFTPKRGKKSTFFDTDLSYATYLTSDSVMDVVIGLQLFDEFKEPPVASNFAMLYRGGEHLYMAGDTAYEDEIEFVDSISSIGYSSQGDWRGTGRDDHILAVREGHGFFYRNDPPFDLREFVAALSRDTLWADWQFPMGGGRMSRLSRTRSMQAFPKHAWDKSVDYMPNFPLRGDSDGNLWMFRGGLNFGSQRLRIDSPDYMIKHPYRLGQDGMTWGPGFMDCGDMTGSGNRVLVVGGRSEGSGIAGIACFYVTGKALDDKIDMFWNESYFAGGPSDTITADKDLLQDFIIGSPEYFQSRGTIHVIHGSTKIPVRINPDMEVKSAAEKSSHAIIVYPLPASEEVAISGLDLSGSALLEIFDGVGRTVLTRKVTPESGRISFDVARLQSGVYPVRISASGSAYLTKISVLR